MSFYKNNYINYQNEQEFPLNNYSQNPNMNSNYKYNNNSQNINNIFNFKQPSKQRFLWKELMKINTNFIRQTKDITPLEPYLDNLLSSSLQEGEVNILPEEYISHLIEILQIIGEYLFYIQKRLEDENGGLKTQFNQTLSKIKDSNNNEKDNLINLLKKENKEKDLLLITYQKILKESQNIGNKNNLIDDSDNDEDENLKNKKEAFYCQFCSGKKFRTEKYLEEHMKRRHLIEYQSNKNGNKKNNMDDKFNEMKEYFENLIRENQISGDYNRLNDRLDNIQNMLFNSKFVPQNYPVNNSNSLNRNNSIPNKQSIYVEKTSIEKLRNSRSNNFNENSQNFRNSQSSIKNIPINKQRNSEIKVSASISQRNSNEPNMRYNNTHFNSKFNEPQIKQQVFSERKNLINNDNNDSINPNLQQLNFNKNQKPKQYNNEYIENTITTKKVIENTEIINNKIENDNNNNQVNEEPENIMKPNQNQLFISQNPNQELPEFGKNNNENIQIQNSEIDNNLQNQDHNKLKAAPPNNLITRKYEIVNEKKEEVNYQDDPRLALDLFYKRFHERDNAIKGESFNEYIIRTIPTSFNVDPNHIDYEINQLIDQDLKKNSNDPNLNQYNLLHLNKDQIFDLITNSFNNIERDANSNDFYRAYNNNINYTVDMTNEIHQADEYYHGLKNEENLKNEKNFYINSNNNINKQINQNNFNNNINNNSEMRSNQSKFTQNNSNNNLNYANNNNNNNFNNNSNINNNNNNNNLKKTTNLSNNNNSKFSNNNTNNENDEFDYE